MARSGEVLGGALVVDHHRCLLGMLLGAGCRGHGAVRQRARSAELRLPMLRVEARLLSQMVSVDDKSPALHHGSRHLEVLGTQIEIGEQRYEVGGQARVNVSVAGDLTQTETTVLLAVRDDLVEALARHVEAALAQVHHALVELADDARGQLLLRVGLGSLSAWLRHLDRTEPVLDSSHELSSALLVV